MAYQLAQAYVSVVPSFKGVGKAINKEFGGVDMSDAGAKAGGSYSNGIMKALSGIKLGALTGAFSAATSFIIGKVSDLSGEIMDASDSAQKFASTMSFASIDTSTIDRLTKSTQDYADKTVFNLGDIRDTTAQLAANGVKDYASLAEAAGNLTAVAGGGADAYRSVAMALTQTAGAGKLTTENWNQIADAIPGASGKLQEAMLKNGAYVGNFRDAMADGQITADEFNQALLQLGMSDVAKQAAANATTMEGAFGNLEAAAVKFGSTMLDKVKPNVTGVINEASDLIGTLTDKASGALDAVGSWISDFVAQLRDNGALQTFSTGLDTIITGLKSIAGVTVDWLKLLPPGSAADTVKSVADALADMVGFATANSDWLLPMIAGIGGLKLAAAGLSTVSSALESIAGGATAVGAAATGFNRFVIYATEMGGLGPALANSAKQLTLVANASKAMTAVGGMGTALKGSLTAIAGISGRLLPIVGIITAIGAALALFFTQTETGRQLWGQFTDFLGNVWTQVQGAWQSALPVIEQLVSNLGSTIGSLMQSALPVIGQLMSNLGTVIGNVLQAALPILQSFGGMLAQIAAPALPAIQQLLAAFQQLGAALASALQASMPAIQSLMTSLGAAFAAIMPSIIQLGTTLMQLVAAVMPSIVQLGTTLMQLVAAVLPQLVSLAEPIAGVIAVIATAVAELLPAIVGVATMLAGALMPVIGEIVSAIAGFLPVVATLVSTLVGMLVPVITAIVNAINELMPVITAVIEAVANVIQAVLPGITQAIQGVITVIQGVITFLTGVFTGDWSKAWDGVKQIFSGVWQAMKGLLDAAWNGIKTAISSGLNVIKSVWTAAWNAVKAFFKTIWDGLKSAAKSGVDAVVNVVKGVRDRITGFFSDAGSWLVNAGRAILDGLVSGLKSAWGKVTSFVGGIGDWIKEHKGPISYDRKLLVPAGQAIMNGLRTGLRSGFTGVRSDVNGMAGRLAPAFDGLFQPRDMQGEYDLGTIATARVTGDMDGGLTREDVTAAMLEALSTLPAIAVQTRDQMAMALLDPIDKGLERNARRNVR